jgi:O-antigen/teichoic acid export membrane protein
LPAPRVLRVRGYAANSGMGDASEDLVRAAGLDKPSSSPYLQELPRPASQSAAEFKRRTIRGGFAKLSAQALNVLLRMGCLMVLARLLQPSDFGLVGMVTAITGVLSLFKEFGLSSATVQRTSISDQQLSTLFWINVLVGATLCVAAVVIAPFVADFYHEPRLSAIMVVLASGFLFNAAGVQHSALLQRQMRFTALAIIDILSLAVSSAISILMAVRGAGYWALVAWSVTLPLVSTLVTWFLVRWTPSWPRLQTDIGSIMRFGGTLTLNSFICYVAYNLDKVLVGRVWGAEAIGVYGRAYQLITLPVDNLNAAVGGVGFAVLSRLQDDPDRLRSYFLKAYSLLLAVTVPVAIVCSLFANDLVLVMLGPQWINAVPVFRVLAPIVLIFALINPPGWLLLALGMVGRSLRMAVVIAPLLIAGYAVGLPYGPTGVAYGFSSAMAVWLFPHLAWCFRGTGIKGRDVAVVVSRPLIAGAAAGLMAFLVIYLVGDFLPPFGRLVLGSSVLCSAYVSLLLFVMGQKTLIADVLREL